MSVNGMLGILTGGTVVALATNSFEADTAGVLWPGFAPGMLMLLGLGLVGLGMWGRKKNGQGTPIDVRYLALGGRKVNFRGTFLFYEQEERRKKIKRLMIVLSVLFVFSVSAFAQMSTGKGGGMMGSWGWGMNSGWLFMIIIAILVILGIVYMMKRR